MCFTLYASLPLVIEHLLVNLKLTVHWHWLLVVYVSSTADGLEAAGYSDYNVCVSYNVYNVCSIYSVH